MTRIGSLSQTKFLISVFRFQFSYHPGESRISLRFHRLTDKIVGVRYADLFQAFLCKIFDTLVSAFKTFETRKLLFVVKT